MSVPVAELPPHDPLPHHCHQAPSHCSVEPLAVPEQLLSKDAEKCTLQPLWFICPSPHHGSSSCTGHAVVSGCLPGRSSGRKPTQTEPDIEPEPEAELELKHPEKGRARGCCGLTYVPEKSTHGCVAAAPGGPPPGRRCERVAAFCPSDWTGAPIAGPLSASHSSSKSGLRRPETSSPADSRHIQTMHIQPALSSSPHRHPSGPLRGRGAVLLGAPICIS